MDNTKIVEKIIGKGVCGEPHVSRFGFEVIVNGVLKDHFAQYNTDKAEFLRTHQTMVKMMMITAQRVARAYEGQRVINVTLLTDTIDEPVGEGQPDNRPVESPEEESTES